MENSFPGVCQSLIRRLAVTAGSKNLKDFAVALFLMTMQRPLSPLARDLVHQNTEIAVFLIFYPYNFPLFLHLHRSPSGKILPFSCEMMFLQMAGSLKATKVVWIVSR